MSLCLFERVKPTLRRLPTVMCIMIRYRPFKLLSSIALNANLLLPIQYCVKTKKNGQLTLLPRQGLGKMAAGARTFFLTTTNKNKKHTRARKKNRKTMRYCYPWRVLRNRLYWPQINKKASGSKGIEIRRAIGAIVLRLFVCCRCAMCHSCCLPVCCIVPRLCPYASR